MRFNEAKRLLAAPLSVTVPSGTKLAVTLVEAHFRPDKT
jgi:hypothetical protein